MTRGTVIKGEDSGLWPAGVEDMRRKENIKNLLWHLYAGLSMKSELTADQSYDAFGVDCGFVGRRSGL
jgi:hypothetical protein